MNSCRPKPHRMHIFAKRCKYWMYNLMQWTIVNPISSSFSFLFIHMFPARCRPTLFYPFHAIQRNESIRQVLLGLPRASRQFLCCMYFICMARDGTTCSMFGTYSCVCVRKWDPFIIEFAQFPRFKRNMLAQHGLFYFEYICCMTCWQCICDGLLQDYANKRNLCLKEYLTERVITMVTVIFAVAVTAWGIDKPLL